MFSSPTYYRHVHFQELDELGRSMGIEDNTLQMQFTNEQQKLQWEDRMAQTGRERMSRGWKKKYKNRRP